MAGTISVVQILEKYDPSFDFEKTAVRRTIPGSVMDAAWRARRLGSEEGFCSGSFWPRTGNSIDIFGEARQVPCIETKS